MRNPFRRKPMSEENKIPLGSHVRDIYTGFEGTLVARTMWLHGCDRLSIEPRKVKEDGTLAESMAFDAPRVELIALEPVRRSADEPTEKTGGPNGPAPKRNPTPR
jgi:hypothetical protein